MACSSGYLKCVNLLLKDIRVKSVLSGRFENLLYDSIYEGNDDCAWAVIEAAYDEKVALEGDTLLHVATRLGKEMIVHNLIQRGDPMSMNRAGQTALDIAKENDDELLQRLLAPLNGGIFHEIFNWHLGVLLKRWDHARTEKIRNEVMKSIHTDGAITNSLLVDQWNKTESVKCSFRYISIQQLNIKI